MSEDQNMQKYTIIEHDDLFNTDVLTRDEYEHFRTCMRKIEQHRVSEGKTLKPDCFVVDMNDVINLGITSPLTKRIETVKDSHKVLIKKFKNGGHYGHNRLPDRIRDISESIIESINTADPWVYRPNTPQR
jgi:hypothetical protein